MRVSLLLRHFLQEEQLGVNITHEHAISAQEVPVAAAAPVFTELRQYLIDEHEKLGGPSSIVL